MSDTPEKCEEYLTKTMVQLEEIEGTFAEFDEFIVQIAERREEIYAAFEARKVALIERRSKRADALATAAERILKGVRTRVDGLESVDEINGFFASDLLIDKIRDIVEQLKDLDDSVKVDDIESRLKTIKEDAVRQLKDRQDLYSGGGNVIQLGNHRFSVNVQALDLTTVTRSGELQLHLTGTNFFEPLDDDELRSLSDVAQLDLTSESPEVYRGEYLAAQFLGCVREADRDGTDLPEEFDSDLSPEALLSLPEEELRRSIQRFMGPRYSEGYVKGVHDHDAALIIHALVDIEERADLLRFHGDVRALAQVFWYQLEETTKEQFTGSFAGLGAVRELFPTAGAGRSFNGDLSRALQDFVEEYDLFDAQLIPSSAAYLEEELVRGKPFVASAKALALVDAIRKHSASADSFGSALERVASRWDTHFRILREWVDAYRSATGDDLVTAATPDEIAALLLTTTSADDNTSETTPVDATVHDELEGLLGEHSRVQEGSLVVDYPDFTQRLAHHIGAVVPRVVRYAHRKHELIDASREQLRLEEFRPRVLTSFVRNQLIDKVYLPLVGDNLAKQMGVVGKDKRTDLMGLLLIVSPPGYGKTTLMEYIANRLGIIFMKINGPAIGHHVTSLDPAEAPNASAREEVEKLNLALEMGDNVMIYLDDIQHCNPEFLQKFISLCDAQRKIEGVYKGRSRTYDLRGRKVAVVMAGNPYTESGERFQIPDMLANRADTYNLGEPSWPSTCSLAGSKKRPSSRSRTKASSSNVSQRPVTTSTNSSARA